MKKTRNKIIYAILTIALILSLSIPQKVSADSSNSVKMSASEGVEAIEAEIIKRNDQEVNIPVAFGITELLRGDEVKISTSEVAFMSWKLNINENTDIVSGDLNSNEIIIKVRATRDIRVNMEKYSLPKIESITPPSASGVTDASITLDYSGVECSLDKNFSSIESSNRYGSTIENLRGGERYYVRIIGGGGYVVADIPSAPVKNNPDSMLKEYEVKVSNSLLNIAEFTFHPASKLLEGAPVKIIAEPIDSGKKIKAIHYSYGGGSYSRDYVENGLQFSMPSSDLFIFKVDLEDIAKENNATGRNTSQGSSPQAGTPQTKPENANVQKNTSNPVNPTNPSKVGNQAKQPNQANQAPQMGNSNQAIKPNQATQMTRPNPEAKPNQITQPGKEGKPNLEANTQKTAAPNQKEAKNETQTPANQADQGKMGEMDKMEQKDSIKPIFKDVKSNDWFATSAIFVNEKGWMKGTQADLFSPSQNTSRAMLVTILHRLVGSPSANETSNFSDIKGDEYFAKAVDWAIKNNIVKGYEDGSFRANDDITREQVAVILYNYAKTTKSNLTGQADLSNFKDVSEISSYATDALKWANAQGLILGKGENLDPKGKATRAEIATIIMRFHEKLK